MKSRDYGWTSADSKDSQHYLFGPILKELELSNCILDIGCGNGAIARDLISEGFDVYGIDVDKGGISIAQRALESDETRFYCVDIESEKLPSELKRFNFDVAISTEVIEHLYSPDSLIEFASNVLKQHGNKLIISTPYHGYLKNMLLSITGKWDYHFTALWEGGHIKFWSKKTLTQLLERHGFNVKKFYGCGRIPFLWKSMILVAEKE